MSGFQFKQFYVAHDRCAMKVGTDGVLLGAWTPVPLPCDHSTRVLDIGTGSGLIALMIAQRLQQHPQWHIDAVDIAPEAVDQAQQNFSASPWSTHLSAVCTPLQSYRTDECEVYDLIVSNPPFFENSLRNPDPGRELARHTDTLSFADLLQNSARLLRFNGKLALILPTETDIVYLAQQTGLYLQRQTFIHTTASKPAKRMLLLLGKSVCAYEPDSLVLIGANGAPRSEAYSLLCRDYYL